MTLVTDPNILAQLNSQGSTAVTDPAILKQLNSEQNKHEKTSAMGAFGRAAFNSVPELIFHLMKQTGATHLPQYPQGPLSEQPGDSEHPVAKGLGDIAGNPLNYLGAGALVKGAAKLGAKTIPITARGIMKQMSGHKAEEIAKATEKYGSLWNDAAEAGVTHAPPTSSAKTNLSRVLDKTTENENEFMKEYLANPTLENAHWAKSDLGRFIRKQDKIHAKNNLTGPELKTLKAAKEAKQELEHSMFHGNPELDTRYQDLTREYAQDVIPYKNLEELTLFERNKLRPKTAVKSLKNNEEFMIELSKRYPGLKMHGKGGKDLLKDIMKMGGIEALGKYLP